MSFLVRRRQRESIRVHGSVSAHGIALVLESLGDGYRERTVNASPSEPSVRDVQRLNELSPQLVETTTFDDGTVPPVSESWRVRAADKAYRSIAPEAVSQLAPRCSRRC